MTDNRSNEQIVRGALLSENWRAIPAQRDAATVVAALAAAGRLVTPEHDAQIRADQREKDAQMALELSQDPEWNNYAQAAAAEIVDRIDAQGVAS